MQLWFLQAMLEHCVPANRISEPLLDTAILVSSGFAGQNNQDGTKYQTVHSKV